MFDNVLCVSLWVDLIRIVKTARFFNVEIHPHSVKLHRKLVSCSFLFILYMTPEQILWTISNSIKSQLKKQWQVNKSPCRRKTFRPNSGKEKLPFKGEETSNISGDLPAEGQLDKGRKEEGDRTERMEDRDDGGQDSQDDREHIQCHWFVVCKFCFYFLLVMIFLIRTTNPFMNIQKCREKLMKSRLTNTTSDWPVFVSLAKVQIFEE